MAGKGGDGMATWRPILRLGAQEAGRPSSRRPRTTSMSSRYFWG